MSDIRFIIIGAALIFSGFAILGILGQTYRTSSIEIEEFGTCFEYSTDKEPVPIDCEQKMIDQSIFFGVVISLIAGGSLCLVKGIKGDWDNKVKPEDMVGPGRDNRLDGNDSDGNQ